MLKMNITWEGLIPVEFRQVLLLSRRPRGISIIMHCGYLLHCLAEG